MSSTCLETCFKCIDLYCSMWAKRWPSRKVAGLIPDYIIGIFRWHNPSGHTMALGSTQPLTEMSIRNISWEVMAENLTTFTC
jgi:hypothetical protein